MKVVGDVSKLVEEIRRRAEEDALTVLERARRAAELERERARQEAERLLREAEERARREAEVFLKRSAALSAREVRAKIFSERERILGEVLHEALERARSMPRDGRYVQVLARLLAEGVSALGGEVEVMLPLQDRSELYGRWDEVERRVRELTGMQVRLKLSDETISAFGGAVLRSPDGRKLYDATFEARAEALKEEVARMLFEGDHDG
ncbi:MAG TPA: hypothetical protein EYP61_05670 [Candidatus Latescibacteria bacterium]|nr:hypothetical protein [Candidatus Latescibacterota bacterium]